MTYNWRRILEGPRGRQLACLLAIDDERRRWPTASTEIDGPLSDAYFYAEVGRPGVSFFGTSEVEPVATQQSDIVTALKNLTPGVIDSELLPEHLNEVVGAAYYWQEPRQIDALLNHPEIIDLLQPWAERLGSLEDVQWWASPWDHEQQFIVDGPRGKSWTTPINQRLSQWREAEMREEAKAARERPSDPAARISGEWWSTPPSQGTTRAWPNGPLRGQLVAVALLEDRYYHEEEAVWGQVVLPQSPRILEITCAQDWVELCRTYPLAVSASRRHDWYHCTGRVGDWVIPDWSQVAHVWDGVHLPLASYLELVGRALDVDGVNATVIAGWSPDMTYWLTVTPEITP